MNPAVPKYTKKDRGLVRVPLPRYLRHGAAELGHPEQKGWACTRAGRPENSRYFLPQRGLRASRVSLCSGSIQTPLSGTPGRLDGRAIRCPLHCCLRAPLPAGPGWPVLHKWCFTPMSSRCTLTTLHHGSLVPAGASRCSHKHEGEVMGLFLTHPVPRAVACGADVDPVRCKARYTTYLGNLRLTFCLRLTQYNAVVGTGSMCKTWRPWSFQLGSRQKGHLLVANRQQSGEESAGASLAFTHDTSSLGRALGLCGCIVWLVLLVPGWYWQSSTVHTAAWWRVRSSLFSSALRRSKAAQHAQGADRGARVRSMRYKPCGSGVSVRWAKGADQRVLGRPREGLMACGCKERLQVTCMMSRMAAILIA